MSFLQGLVSMWKVVMADVFYTYWESMEDCPDGKQSHYLTSVVEYHFSNDDLCMDGLFHHWAQPPFVAGILGVVGRRKCEHQHLHLSASGLWLQCEQLPRVLVAMTALPWARVNPALLKLILSCVLSLQQEEYLMAFWLDWQWKRMADNVNLAKKPWLQNSAKWAQDQTSL